MRRGMKCLVVLVCVPVVLGICGFAGASPPVPYPTAPNWVTPSGCYDTTLVYEGDQFGHIEVADIKFMPAVQLPYDTHVVVAVKDGYWLMQVRGGWIKPDHQADGFFWDNQDGVAKRSYERDGYGAGIGITAVACQYPCLATPPTLPGTPGTSAPEQPCIVPPTTAAAVIATSTTTPSTTAPTPISEVSVQVSPSSITPPSAQAVVATPQFTG